MYLFIFLLSKLFYYFNFIINLFMKKFQKVAGRHLRYSTTSRKLTLPYCFEQVYKSYLLVCLSTPGRHKLIDESLFLS